MDVDDKELTEFLQEWRTRSQIEERFGLSNSESFHLLRWLQKGKYIEATSLNLTGRRKPNRTFLYRSISIEIKEE